MQLETSRLILRPFQPDDLSDLQEILGDTGTMQHVEPAYHPAQTEAFLQGFCIGKRGAFAAVQKATGKVIGYVLFHPYGEPEVYEIGWIFNRNYWRRGYAFEACSALVRYAFSELGAHKVFAETIDPVKSVGLMKKLGMQPEGVQRRQTRDHTGQWADLHLYGLLREDFEKHEHA